MKKIVSLLVLTLVAVLGITASAKTVTLKFSDPAGVEKVTDGNYSAPQEFHPDDQGEITMDLKANPAVYLNDGYSIESIKDITSDVDIDVPTDYGYGIGIYVYYDNSILDGDTILITITSDGGSEGGGGNQGGNNDDWVYTIICPESVQVISYSDLTVSEYRDDAYYVTGMSQFPSATFNINGTDIESIRANGSELTTQYPGFYTVNVSDYPESTSFIVTCKEEPKYFTINCEADIFTFSSDTPPVTATYDNGAYTVSGFNYSLEATMKTEFQSQYNVSLITTNGQQIWNNNSKGIYISASQYPSGTEFNVELEAITTGGGDEEGGGDDEGLITINVTDQNYISAQNTGNGQWLTFADNTLQYDLADGASIRFMSANGATIVAITTDATNAESGEPVTVNVNGRYPATDITATLSNIPAGSTIDVTLNIPAAREFTFSGVEGLNVTFGGVQADYENGVYTVSNLTNNFLSVEVSVPEALASTLKLVSVVPDGGDAITPDSSSGICYISEYNYPTSTHFVINTEEIQASQSVTTSFHIMNGQAYNMDMWNATTGSLIEIYTNNPTDVTFNYGDALFIGKTNKTKPYQIVVDGEVVPDELCNTWDNFHQKYGYMLTPECGYYPTDGGTVEIYQEKPESTTYDVTFTFANEGTQDFISQIKVGYGAMMEADEVAEVLANGKMTVDAGQNFEIYFNFADYTFTSATVNGNALELSETDNSYINKAVDQDLAFTFDVNKTGGYLVTFKCENWQGITVNDRNGVNIELTGAECEVELSTSSEEIRIVAADGYTIAENGISILYPETSTPVLVAGGSYFEVQNGMEVTVNVTRNADASTLTFTFVSEYDVLEFTGYPTDPTASYADGKYTVTDIPQTSLYGQIKEEFRDDYVIDNVTFAGGTIPCGNGFSFSVPMTSINSDTEFTVNYKGATAEPRNVTITVNNASYISRIYNNNATITSFPAEYDLNNGTTFTVEAANDCTIESVTVNGNSVSGNTPGSEITVDLDGIEEGATVVITAAGPTGDFSYEFSGPEGLVINYRGINADYADGVYTLGISESTIGDYPITISVAGGYENKVIILSVTDGSETWTPIGASGVINIPGSQLPRQDTKFTVATRVPEASETTRTVYLTIDNVDVVMYGRYQGGSSSYITFDNEGVATLTISPAQYTVEVATTTSITQITTDAAEDTFTMPNLPATNIVLNLLNAVEGQTINLITEQPEELAIEIGAEPEVTVNDGVATVALEITVSEGLVGKDINVTVNGKDNTVYTPGQTEGTLTVTIDLAGLEDGDHEFVIALSYEDVTESVTVSVNVAGIFSVYADENGEVEIYNLHGIKVKPGNVVPGFYIVNGHKVFVK